MGQTRLETEGDFRSRCLAYLGLDFRLRLTLVICSSPAENDTCINNDLASYVTYNYLGCFYTELSNRTHDSR